MIATKQGWSRKAVCRAFLLGMLCLLPRARADTPALNAGATQDNTADAERSPDDSHGEVPQLPPGHPPIHPDAETAPSSDGSLQQTTDVPPHNVWVLVVDLHGLPVSGAHVVLQIHRESVAQGNLDTERALITDGSGQARFDQLSTDSSTSYRLLLNEDGAHYGLDPFQLNNELGVSAVLRRFPAVRDIRKALVASETLVFVEPRDSVFHIEVAYRIYNVGTVTWISDGTEIRLPENRQAFNSQSNSDDIHAEASAAGVRLVGAVAPGQHQVIYTFQVPRHNVERATFEIGLPPNTMQARIGAPAAKSTELVAEGFQQTQRVTSENGQRMLMAAQAFDRSEHLPGNMRFELRGLPTLGEGRLVAAVIAALLVASGLLWVLLRRRGSKFDTRPLQLESKARTRLLEELRDLEQAKAAGSIGPETYSQIRQTLIDALVRLEPAVEA